MILEICCDDPSIPPIADTARLTTSPDSVVSVFIAATTFAASPAPPAVCFMLAVNCSTAASVSSRLAACLSVRRDKSSEAAAISSAPNLMPATECATADTAACSFATASLKSALS